MAPSLTTMCRLLISTLIFFICFNTHSEPTGDRADFSDGTLQTILEESVKQKNSGLIYVWSPRMPLSGLGVEEITEIAKKWNLPVHIIVDPSAQEDEILNFDKSNNLLRNSPRLTSSTLISMSMKIHYPSLVIYKNGQLLSPSRPGYDEPERAEAYILKRLK